MREIKFRAWDKDSKEMIPLFNIDFEHNIMNKGSLWKSLYSVELLQYTGLKDKNGKEIYEGDYTSSGMMIDFYEGMFIPFYDWGNQERYEDVGCDWWSKCEIIGNKYENPNLPEEYDR